MPDCVLSAFILRQEKEKKREKEGQEKRRREALGEGKTGSAPQPQAGGFAH